MQRLCMCLQKTPEQLGLWHGIHKDQAFPITHESQGHTLSSSLVSTSSYARTGCQDTLEHVGAEGPTGVPSEGIHTFKQAKGSCPPISDFPAPSFADMVQLPQTRLPETVSADQGALRPLTFSLPLSSQEMACGDSAAWFGVRVNDLKAVGAFWHEPPLTSQQQQAIIHAELETWNEMTDQDHLSTNEYRITRRMAFVALATLPASLLVKVQFGPLTTFVTEEFLAESATSIVACWHLLGEDGLATAEQVLPTYLPLLKTLAQQSSFYRCKAAYLAAQGCLLSGLLATHRLPVPKNLHQRLEHCREAIKYSKLSGNRTLHVMSLIHYGYTLYYQGQLSRMLQAYQEATSFIDEIPVLLKSKLLAGLAHAYAQNGRVQEALSSIDDAHAIFPQESETVPIFVSTDCGIFSLIMDEGRVHLVLGHHENDQRHALARYKQSEQALSQIEALQPGIIIPERFRIEIVNQQALAAVKTEDLDAFEYYLIRGATSAKSLGSQQRLQEFIASWQTARKIWPDEKRVWELADILF